MKDNPIDNHSHPRALSANSLIGSAVRNPEGEHLGTIIDLMVDLETGQVTYAVLAVGGFLGLGETLFAPSWDALAVDTKRRCFLLNADKEWLHHAAGFDKHAWPETPDRRFGHDGYRRPRTMRNGKRVAVGI